MGIGLGRERKAPRETWVEERSGKLLATPEGPFRSHEVEVTIDDMGIHIGCISLTTKAWELLQWKVKEQQ